MRDKAKAAHAALERLGVRGRTTRIPDDVRRPVLSYVTAARAERVSWREISEELGLSRTVLQRWLRARAEPGRRLRPVRVRVPVPSRSYRLVAPSGHRVEGLSLEDAARLLELVA